METISTLDLLAALHLLIVGGVLACGAIEVVFEYYALFFDRTLHHSAIRIHYWVDILVEIPLFIGVALTGTLMLLQLETISGLHLAKVGVSYVIVIGFAVCAMETFRRKRLLDEGAEEEILLASTRSMMVRNVAIIGVLTQFVLFSGLWLSYQRLQGYLS
jgi:hypothetical protein